MRRCFHCILIGKIDKLKPLTPVATLLFLLAGHHQLARAYLSVAIEALPSPIQAFDHNGLLKSRNIHKRPIKESPTMINVIISIIFFSVSDAYVFEGTLCLLPDTETTA
jgi:hypothetical protein